MKEKSETYNKNIDKRGNVPNSISVSFISFYKLVYRKKEIDFQLDQPYLDFSFLL